MDTVINVKKINKNHIGDVVDVHCTSFRDFFLTELGRDFLYLYYSSYSKCNSAILFGCFENEKLIGFCAAAEKSVGFNLELVKVNFSKFVKQGILLLISNPKSLLRLYFNSNKNSNSVNDEVDSAELFSIGVLPLKQNHGVGKILIKELEAELKLRNCKMLTLTTDAEKNENVLNFYKKMGFSLLYNFTAYPNRKMSRLIKKI